MAELFLFVSFSPIVYCATLCMTLWQNQLSSNSLDAARRHIISAYPDVFRDVVAQLSYNKNLHRRPNAPVPAGAITAAGVDVDEELKRLVDGDAPVDVSDDADAVSLDAAQRNVTFRFDPNDDDDGDAGSDADTTDAPAAPAATNAASARAFLDSIAHARRSARTIAAARPAATTADAAPMQSQAQKARADYNNARIALHNAEFDLEAARAAAAAPFTSPNTPVRDNDDSAQVALESARRHQRANQRLVQNAEAAVSQAREALIYAEQELMLRCYPPFLARYTGRAKELPEYDGDYIELRGDMNSIDAVANVLARKRLPDGTLMSQQNLKATIEDMLQIEMRAPHYVLERTNDPHTGEVVFKLVMTGEERSYTIMQRLPNDRLLDPRGDHNANGMRYYISTHALLNSMSLNEAMASSVAAMGFSHSLPRRVILNIPLKAQLMQGDPATLLHGVFQVVDVPCQPDEAFISAITASRLRSASRT